MLKVKYPETNFAQIFWMPKLVGLKNTLDPYPRSVGPPDIYRPYAKSKISRDKFRTNILDAQISGVYSIDYGVL